MKTEIVAEKLVEYFYPSANFERSDDGAVVDYAEIEIIPQGISKLEENLDRCGSPEQFTEQDWKALNEPCDDAYEHIVAYVHFNASTDVFNKLFLSVVTSHDSVELSVDSLLNEEEKQVIITAALESLHRWRGTDYM